MEIDARNIPIANANLTSNILSMIHAKRKLAAKYTFYSFCVNSIWIQFTRVLDSLKNLVLSMLWT